MRNDNLKKTGQLRNFWVEFGFGTVCIISSIQCNKMLYSTQAVHWTADETHCGNFNTVMCIVVHSKRSAFEIQHVIQCSEV